VCVCVRVCMSECVSECVCVRENLSVYVCKHGCIYVFIIIHTYVCVCSTMNCGTPTRPHPKFAFSEARNKLAGIVMVEFETSVSLFLLGLLSPCGVQRVPLFGDLLDDVFWQGCASNPPAMTCALL